MRYFLPLLAILFVVSAPRARADGPLLSAIATAAWAENITRCPDPAAVKNATLYEITGNAEWRRQVTREATVQFAADAGWQSCPEFSGLDHASLGLCIAVRHKPGLGPFAPVWRADISYTDSWYRNTEHNGTRLYASVSWSQRWNDSWQTVLTGEYLHNDGHSPAYDHQNHGLALEVCYDLAAQWQLTSGLRRQWGDQVAYAWLGGSGASFPYVFEIWKNTTDSATFGRNWYAYTMDAHADSGWLSVSRALGNKSSLTLRFEETSVVGQGESYRTSQVSLNFAHRF